MDNTNIFAEKNTNNASFVESREKDNRTFTYTELQMQFMFSERTCNDGFGAL